MLQPVEGIVDRSQEINHIIKALTLAYPEFGPIVKDKWNDHFKSYFADIASIRKAINPALVKHGLFIVQAPTSDNSSVAIVTTIYHESGQFIGGIFMGEARNAQTQSIAAAVTYLCRYALICMLGLELGEDDDGNSTQKETSAVAKYVLQSSDNPPPPPGSAVGNADVFDLARDKADFEAELQHRNVPPGRWAAIGKWLQGKDTKLLSRAIAEA